MNALLRYWRRYQRTRRVKTTCAALRKAGRENPEAAEALASFLRPMTEIGVFTTVQWRCLRCESVVDMEAFRCDCVTSPSPWEPVDDILHGGQS